MRRTLIAIAELLVLSALIIATRCANFADVFVGGEIYFTDADCYARMTRVRICLEHPGTIVRHHGFENFPSGTTPHTTAPFDYLIAVLSTLMGGAIDVAGAIVSPALALLTGWFLWWWSRRIRLPYRGALLLLFALSPILVHGTELGRPDHQSLVLALIAIALCAEWTLTTTDSRGWSVTSGVAWGLALWVSLYEPLILLAILGLVQLIAARKIFLTRNRLIGWAVCGALVLLALLIERRLPPWPATGETFSNWAATIGELRAVWPNDPVWLRWTGLLLIPFPALLWIAFRSRTIPVFLATLLTASFALTIWQARWAYFFMMLFALSLPICLSFIKHRIAGWTLIAISFFPILKDWDERLWPNDFQRGAIAERRMENIGMRQTALQIDGPFLAPWWWSPAIAYWSRQPGVAGSSHEALPGIADSARFFAATDSEVAKSILLKTKVAWVLAYDADRTVANSAAILGLPPPQTPLGKILDRTPSQAPPFLRLSAQNPAGKLFRV
ncbi:MAG TPA: hypothetical protein VLH83_01220, partial [Chthoniobacterales bacterium]|nr:hypothetical protein [Chthoniobacterales bacterium]